MSVCAVMLVKDEADIVLHTIRHLLANVDAILVADNMSSDWTREHISDVARQHPQIELINDEEIAYEQSAKTTKLAQIARTRGYQWVLPCDADEYWYAPDGRSISMWLDGIAPDIQIVRTELVNHIPTGHDNPAVDSPFQRIGWRLRAHAPIGKVCFRADPDMVVHMGNHSCWLPGAMQTIPGLIVRHYSWRSEAQYANKIRNGAAAYAATAMGEDVGAHWRMFGNPPDDAAVREHFRRWFFCEDPTSNPSLIYDPAPFTT